MRDTPKPQDVMRAPRRLLFDTIMREDDGACEEHEEPDRGNNPCRECPMKGGTGRRMRSILTNTTLRQKEAASKDCEENELVYEKVRDRGNDHKNPPGSKLFLSVGKPQFSSTGLGSRGARRGAGTGAIQREIQTSSAQQLAGEEVDGDGEVFFGGSRRGGLPRTPITRQSGRTSKNPNRYGYHQEKHYHFVTSWSLSLVFYVKIVLGS